MGRLLYGAHPSACPLPNILAVHLQPFRASRSCSPPVMLIWVSARPLSPHGLGTDPPAHIGRARAFQSALLTYSTKNSPFPRTLRRPRPDAKGQAVWTPSLPTPKPPAHPQCSTPSPGGLRVLFRPLWRN